MRRVYIFFAMAMVIILSGCQKNEIDNYPVNVVEDVSDEYTVELIDVSEYMIHKSCFTFFDEACFETFFLVRDEDDKVYIHKYSYNIDSGEFSDMKMTIPHTDDENFSIYGIAKCSQGYVLSVAYGSYPNGLGYICIVDDHGEVISSTDEVDKCHSDLHVDSEGNIYCIKDEKTLNVYSQSLEFLFSVECPDTLIGMGEIGDDMHLLFYDGDAGREDGVGYVVKRLDFDSQSFATDAYTENMYGVYDRMSVLSDSEYDLAYTNQTNAEVYLHEFQSGKVMKIADMMDYGIEGAGVDSVLNFGDDIYLFSSGGPERNLQYLIAIRKSSDGEAQRECIRYAKTSNTIPDAVYEYNKSNKDCYIKVTDYSDDISRLEMEIINGEIPDIIDTGGIDFEGFAKKGIFSEMDSYAMKYRINEKLADSLRIDGKLYEIPLCADMTGLISHETWGNSRSFMELEEKGLNEGYTYSVALWNEEDFILRMIKSQEEYYLSASDSFIDKQFIDMLKWSKKRQDDLLAGHYVEQEDYLEGNAVAMDYCMDLNFTSCNLLDSDPDAVFLKPDGTEGVIMELESGLAISNDSEYKEEIEAFLEMAYQSDSAILFLDGEAEKEAERIKGERDQYSNPERYTDEKLAKISEALIFDEKDILIRKYAGYEGIVREEIDSYFENKISAEQCAQNIQNRIDTYMAERQ